jgi:hypothetical protein
MSGNTLPREEVIPEHESQYECTNCGELKFKEDGGKWCYFNECSAVCEACALEKACNFCGTYYADSCNSTSRGFPVVRKCGDCNRSVCIHCNSIHECIREM